MEMKRVVPILLGMVISVAILLINYYLIPGIALLLPFLAAAGIAHLAVKSQPKRPFLLVLACVIVAFGIYDCVWFLNQPAETADAALMMIILLFFLAADVAYRYVKSEPKRPFQLVLACAIAAYAIYDCVKYVKRRAEKAVAQSASVSELENKNKIKE